MEGEERKDWKEEGEEWERESEQWRAWQCQEGDNSWRGSTPRREEVGDEREEEKRAQR